MKKRYINLAKPRLSISTIKPSAPEVFDTDKFEKISDKTLIEKFETYHQQHLSKLIEITLSNLAFDTALNNVEKNINRVTNDAVDIDPDNIIRTNVERQFNDLIKFYCLEQGLDILVSAEIKSQLIEKLTPLTRQTSLKDMLVASNVQQDISAIGNSLGVDTSPETKPYGENQTEDKNSKSKSLPIAARRHGQNKSRS